MRILTTFIAGLLISYAIYTGCYNYWLEPLGKIEFILQETIGLDDSTDKLIWCEGGSYCTIEESVRTNGIDPFNLIGVATKEFPVYRLDGPITAVSSMFMDRELVRHLGIVISMLASSLAWCVVLTIGLLTIPR